MRLTILILCVVLGAPLVARANGYELYPAPIVWSADSQYLAAWDGAPLYEGSESAAWGGIMLADHNGRYLAYLGEGTYNSPSFSHDNSKLYCVKDGDVWAFDIVVDDTGTLPGTQLTQRGDVLEVLAHNPPWAGGAGESSNPGTRGVPDWVYYTAGPRFYGCAIHSFMEEAFVLTAADGGSALAPLAAGVDIFCLVQGGAEGAPEYERLAGLNPQTLELTRLTQEQPAGEFGYHESNLQLLPDGRVLFQRGGWGHWDLFSVDPATGEECLEVRDAAQPSLSADGRWLAFVRRSVIAPELDAVDWEVTATVWLRDRESGMEWQVGDDLGYCLFPSISPDGQRLAWLEPIEGMAGLVVRYLPALTGNAVSYE